MSKKKPNKFDQFDWRYPVVTSATGITAFVGCPRSWIFDKIWKMPRKPMAPAAFGETLHAAAQRFVSADARGIDPKTGQEVDLFPEGWDAEVSQPEAALIRELINAAITGGVLRRLPNAEAELAFQYEAAQGASVMGFGDIVAEDGYEDHKSTKDFRYNESPESLANNIQMLIGAAVVITRALQQGVNLKEVWLRHNYFLKDRSDPKVKSVEVTVSTEAVMKFWEEIVVPVTAKMVEWKRKLVGTNATKWRDVPGATSPGICKKYGGCAFAGICGGRETTEEYRVRMTRQVEQAETQRKETEDIMTDIFATAKQRKRPTPTPDLPKAEAAPEQEVVVETEVEVVEATAAPASPAVLSTAPWAMEGCVACSGNPTPGFNSQGLPCKACDAAQRRAGGPTSDLFVISFDDGKMIIEPRDSDSDLPMAVIPWVGEVAVAGAPAPSKPKTTAKTEKRQAQTARSVEAALSDTPAPAAIDIEAPKATTKPDEPVKAQKATTKKDDKPAKAGGRPKKGFTLIYGTRKRGRGDTVDLHQTLQELGTALAESMGAKTYYDLDFGKRRDWLASRAEAIGESFGPATVLVTGTDPDILALANAVEPFATNVFVGS